MQAEMRFDFSDCSVILVPIIQKWKVNEKADINWEQIEKDIIAVFQDGYSGKRQKYK